MSNAPDILDTQSPYWLRLYGQWIHLNGIMPVNEVEPGRAFSELVTVDGYRYEQRAPRGPRTWELPYRFGTAAATAVLESAAYDVVQTTAPSGQTLLLDTNAAKVNMVRPEMTIQAEASSTLPPIMAGGVMLPSMRQGAQEYDYIPVRAGVTYTAAVWTTAPADDFVLVINRPGIGNIVGYAAGGGTPSDPELVHITWTPSDDEGIYVYGTTDTGSTAGLMFFEGDCPPERYRRGRRMPCPVSVHDPKITNNLIWRYCDPCKLPREHVSFVIQEVGQHAVSGVFA